MKKLKIIIVVGARPQFIKTAVLFRYLPVHRLSKHLHVSLVHTGQHYDWLLSDIFFKELNVPRPEYNLGVASHCPTVQLSKMMRGLEAVLSRQRPTGILVFGDTNSTLAAAIVAVHLDIPLVHVESGERIFRRVNVPEEINRILTDNCAGLCLTSTQRAAANLLREGMNLRRVRFVGDLMYDLFKWAVPLVDKYAPDTAQSLGLNEGKYYLATIHRAENTFDQDTLIGLLKTFDLSGLPVILPMHPRASALLVRCKWRPRRNLRIIKPLGYFDFLSLLLKCKVCITDSGGVTREAFFAKKPCVIPMQNSWWVDIIESGWAVNTGSDRKIILDALENFNIPDDYPEGIFGDGNSACKIIKESFAFLNKTKKEASWSQDRDLSELSWGKSAKDFTYDKYRLRLRELKERGYLFAEFTDGLRLLKKKEKFVLLRHDIDFDLEKAQRIAEIENEEGVRATYFFMLRTAHYNIFSQEGSDIVFKILKMGHSLGLHFDSTIYPDNNIKKLSRAISREASLLQRWFGYKVKIVSFHRPNKLILSGKPRIAGGFLHTYTKLFTVKIKYLSDSAGTWREGLPNESEAFRNGRPLHILVHPIWLNSVPTSPYETLNLYVDKNREKTKESVAHNCRVYCNYET